MAKSLKDGRRGGGHRRWTDFGHGVPKMSFLSVRDKKVRWHRHNRRMSIRSCQEQFNAMEDECLAELTDKEYAILCYEDQQGWLADYLDWQEEQDSHHYDEEYDTDWHEADMYNHADRFDDIYGYPGNEEPDVDPELYLAVDRAVREHGLDATYRITSIIATLFSTHPQEVARCIALTPQGYVRSYY